MQNKGPNAPHTRGTNGKALTAWSLFLLFLFGPCQALIPLLMAPAAQHHRFWGLLDTGTFSLTTPSSHLGLMTMRVVFLERYGNVFAGFAIAASGLPIQLVGPWFAHKDHP